MKRKEARQLFDEIGETLGRTHITCVVNGEKFDAQQIQVGLMTGFAYASTRLKEDADHPASVDEDIQDLIKAAIEGYFRFFSEEEE